MSANSKEVLFYRRTKEILEKMAPGIDLKRYYNLVDYLPDTDNNGQITKGKVGLSQVFYLMVGHSQNATMIANVIKFNEKFDFLDTVFCGFDPVKVCAKYQVNEIVQGDDSRIIKLVDDLRQGLVWNRNKSTSRPDSLAKRFASAALNGAFFLSKFKDKDELLDTLYAHYAGKDFKQFMKYFRANNPTGFSIALTCDFLKELDCRFNDLAKPDVHIIDTLSALDQDNKKYLNEKGAYACIDRMREIVSIINHEIKENITVYQLDRMIWLVCTGNFFLDTTYKPEYLKIVSQLT